jgi:two-component system, NarL family, nitrate/nitrite response regulator NarL
MPPKSIRVVIADDHPIVLDGLTTILSATPSIQLVGVARSFSELIALLDSVSTEILVLDLGGMGGAPLTLVNRMQRVYPDVRIVIFSSSVDLAPELIQAGVRGYITKEDLSEQLVAAIHAVRNGQRYFSQVVQDYLLQATTLHKQHHISPKELSVLKLLAQGLGTNAIAEHLGIDPRSVQNHITTLRRKIGCAERTQLVDWYRRMYGIAPQASTDNNDGSS